MIPVLLAVAALAARVGSVATAARAGTVAGAAPAGSVVFLSPTVAELPPPASGPALRLTVRNGRVSPGISAAQLGSPLQITALDAVFSDLSVYFGLSELAFRHKFVTAGDVSRTRLSRPGLMTIENENSPTDRAYIYVAPTACFSIAGPDGRYRLSGVPPGKRRITCWSEKTGTQDREVAVPAAGVAQLDFDLKK